MKKGQEWTEEQVNYLQEHYPYERAEDIGTVIGKTKVAVQKKAFMLKIGKDKEGFFDIRSKAHSGEHSGNFKGYRRKSTKGYILVRKKDHPFADKRGYVMEHRLVMEKQLGFVLPKEFAVHHINGIKDDNRIENLAVMTNSAHSILHNKTDGKQKKGKENPMYKKLDVKRAKELTAAGYTVREVCEMLNVKRTKYYREMKGA